VQQAAILLMLSSLPV